MALKQGEDFTVDEQNLLLTGFNNLIETKRKELKTITAIEQYPKF